MRPSLSWLIVKLRLALRAEQRRIVRHRRVSPAILDAQIREVTKQIERVAPINCMAALLVAFLYDGETTSWGLLLASAALIASTLIGLVTLPKARHGRVRYRAQVAERRALHIYSVLTGITWSAILVIPIVGADETKRMLLLCTLAAAMGMGGLTLAMLPIGAALYAVTMGAGLALAFYLQPTPVPPVFYFAAALYVAMLSRTFIDLANLFVGQLQSAEELARAERKRGDEQRREVERRAAERAEADHARAQARAEEQARHREDMLRLARDFEASVVKVVRMLGEAVANLQGSSTALHQIGRETSAQAAAVSARATSASSAVSSVAAASEEMQQAVEDVNARVGEQVEATTTARASAEATRRTLSELAASADDIASIATLIQDIAARTNLLALNATIEAARAGEAGRGFAVVAQEVKSLAAQTGQAIGRIGETVQTIQGRLGDAMAAVEKASIEVEAVTTRAGAIAAAVTQQRRASADIGHNAANAAVDAAEVHSNIHHVAESARETGALTESMRSLAATLEAQSRALDGATTEFLAQLRAA